MYGIRYLRIFDYISVSKCSTGPARESEVYSRRSQMGKTKEAAHQSLSYDHCLVTQHPWVQPTQQQLEAEVQAIRVLFIYIHIHKQYTYIYIYMHMYIFYVHVTNETTHLYMYIYVYAQDRARKRGWSQTNFVELWSVSHPRLAEMAIEIWVTCQLTEKLFETSSVQ